MKIGNHVCIIYRLSDQWGIDVGVVRNKRIGTVVEWKLMICVVKLLKISQLLLQLLKERIIRHKKLLFFRKKIIFPADGFYCFFMIKCDRFKGQRVNFIDKQTDLFLNLRRRSDTWFPGVGVTLGSPGVGVTLGSPGVGVTSGSPGVGVGAGLISGSPGVGVGSSGVSSGSPGMEIKSSSGWSEKSLSELSSAVSAAKTAGVVVNIIPDTNVMHKHLVRYLFFILERCSLLSSNILYVCKVRTNAFLQLKYQRTYFSTLFF